MAVPASGELSLRAIRNELSANNYSGTSQFANVSLNSMSVGTNGTINTNNASADRPNGSAPHNMSEFYSYDHDATAAVTYTSFAATGPITSYGATPCGQTAALETLYHDGSGTLPTVNDNVYGDSAGNTDARDGGWLVFSQYFITSQGEVTEFGNCSKSERRLKYNIEFIGDSPMGIPTYHFHNPDDVHELDEIL